MSEHPAVAVVVGNPKAASRTRAVEVHLRPLLVEIGATVPTRGLFVLEEQLDHLDDVLDAWAANAAPYLAAVTGRLTLDGAGSTG
jgi:FMN reductase